ncbi:hypothetical protein [Microbacterium sp.]
MGFATAIGAGAVVAGILAARSRRRRT